jgi:ribosomal protein S18 acetylase RimI-like enzyme
MEEIAIEPLTATPENIRMLSEILVQTVASGGSVGFMHPVEPAAAATFWEQALSAAALGKRVVLGAWVNRTLAGTVTLLLDLPVNQPHRAEIAKMMTRPDLRGRGVATALIRAAEELAIRHKRTLLVLDTAVDGGASRFYEKLGYTLAGSIPDYALKPHGGLTGTNLYFKRLGHLRP